MGLIKCPDCGEMISEHAEHCIHCGCPMYEIKKSLQGEEIDETGYLEDARKGDSIAQMKYAECLYHGENVDDDIDAALEWFTKSAKQGNSDALEYLGIIYQAGDDVEQDLEYAMKCYHFAADRGNEHAKSEWAYYQYVEVGKEDDSIIFDYANDSMRDYLKSKYVVAQCLYFGHCGVKENNKVSFDLFLEIFNTDDLEQIFDEDEDILRYLRSEAAYYLSTFYENGYDIDVDMNNALYYIHEANKLSDNAYADTEKEIHNKISETSSFDMYINKIGNRMNSCWDKSHDVSDVSKDRVLNDILLKCIGNELLPAYFNENDRESLELAYKILQSLSNKSLERQQKRICSYFYGLYYYKGLLGDVDIKLASKYFRDCVGLPNEKNGYLSYGFSNDDEEESEIISMYIGNIDNFVDNAKSIISELNSEGLEENDFKDIKIEDDIENDDEECFDTEEYEEELYNEPENLDESMANDYEPSVLPVEDDYEMNNRFSYERRTGRDYYDDIDPDDMDGFDYMDNEDYDENDYEQYIDDQNDDY